MAGCNIMNTKETLNKGLKRGYECVIPAADVDKMIANELKKVGATAKISGFRPGKIPAKVLEKRYGEAVTADVVRHVVTDAVTETIKSNNLRPALQPKLDEEPYEKGEDLTVKFEVEILPDVPSVDYKAITVEREVFEVGEGDLEAALQRVAERSKEPKEKAKTTKAKKGHVVTINFAGKVDGELFEGGTAEGYQLELGSGQFIGDFEEQLEGMKADEETVVKVSFPENYFNKELAGKPAEFDVKLLSVSELVVPEIDDEFAQKAGLKDLDDLKAAVKEQLENEFKNIVRTNTKKRLFDQLETAVEFEIPEGMFDLEFESIWSKVKQAKEDGDEELKDKSEDALKKEYTAIAERRVRLGILLADVGKTQGLDVTSNELSAALLQYARNFPGQEERLVEFYRSNPERLDEFRGPILEDKAVDWIFGQISYNDVSKSVQDIMEEVESE